MGIKTVLLASVLALVAILVAMIMQEPVPEGATSPYKLKLLFFIIHIRQKYLPDLAEAFGLGTVLEMRRDVCNTEVGWTAPGVKMRDSVFDGVPVRLYFPPEYDSTDGASSTLPGILLFHGGGFVSCSVDSHMHISSRLAFDVGAVVVAVDYRLAPEVTYTDILDDVTRASKYFMANSGDFGVDALRIAMAGDSAGGQLVTSLALKLRDTDWHPMPKLQVLVYPVLQGFDFSLPSHQQNANGPFVLLEDIPWMFSLILLGNSTKTDVIFRHDHLPRDVRERLRSTHLNHEHVPAELRYPPYKGPAKIRDDYDMTLWAEVKDLMLDPYFTPLLADDLSGLPPAVIYVGKYDALRDDGILYAQRLRAAGVPVHLRCDPLGWHPTWSFFLMDQDSEQATVWIHSSINERL